MVPKKGFDLLIERDVDGDFHAEVAGGKAAPRAGNGNGLGGIAGYDLFCMLLQREGLVQLVYKHAVSTIQPSHPLNLAEETSGSAED